MCTYTWYPPPIDLPFWLLLSAEVRASTCCCDARVRFQGFKKVIGICTSPRARLKQLQKLKKLFFETTVSTFSAWKVKKKFFFFFFKKTSSTFSTFPKRSLGPRDFLSEKVEKVENFFFTTAFKLFRPGKL